MTSAEYEDDVAVVVGRELALGSFGLNAELARVRRKPSYYSRNRQKDIVFDVSVEVTCRGATEPFIVWVLECKKYGHKVPVDDVEELHAKLEQIGADKTKGTVVTTVGFDSGTIEYSRSKGIGLWRYNSGGEIVYVIQSQELIRRVILSGLEDDCGFTPRFFGLTSDDQPSIELVGTIRWELASLGWKKAEPGAAADGGA